MYDGNGGVSADDHTSGGGDDDAREEEREKKASVLIGPAGQAARGGVASHFGAAIAGWVDPRGGARGRRWERVG